MAERVVFDTNIWISGLLWRGKPYQCLLLARAGVVQAVYCPTMVAEFAQKLRQVPVLWLKRYGHLIPGAAFFFLTDDGDLEQ